MRFKDGFELVHVAEENILVPIGEHKEMFKGVVVLNDAAAMIIEEMKQNITIDDMVQLLISRYDVDTATAEHDIAKMIATINEFGLLIE